jgi:hypothetical protein
MALERHRGIKGEADMRNEIKIKSLKEEIKASKLNLREYERKLRQIEVLYERELETLNAATAALQAEERGE